MESYRVHICPVGYEVDRVVIPLIQKKADRVYLISKNEGRGNPDRAIPFLNEIIKKLDDKEIPFLVQRCDIGDLLDVLKTIGIICQKEHGNQILINVSSGNKVMAIACMMACMMWNGTPYYVVPVRYSKEEEPLTYGVERIVPLPKYKIDRPPENVLACLKYIKQRKPNGASKKSLIQFLEENMIMSIPAPDDGVKISIQAKYRNLEEHFLKPAREWGFVLEEGKTKNKRIKLTQEGEAALAVFGSTIENIIC